MLSSYRAVILLIIGLAAAPPAPAEFALKDGDTVAFLGDSITAARGYTKIVEHYALMRFPERKLRFVNAGKGGDTASGCLSRLENDVFSQGATVVTVAFGINDIGWGMKADAAHKQLYLDGLRSIIEQCRARHVRPIICSAAITAEDPEKAEHSYLQAMMDEGLALAKSLGVETIDLQRGMREIQRRIVSANAGEKDETKRTVLHVTDGIHLNDLGHLVMAYAMLKGLGAPETVSSVTLDASQKDPVNSTGCEITEYALREDGLTFTRLDQGLPLNLGPFSALNYRWVPLPDGLNRYMLTIRNLPPGSYDILAEGRSIGTAKAAQLASGLNISSMTSNGWEPGGPWDAQSVVVKDLIDARDKLSNGAREQARLLPTRPQKSALAEQARKLEDDLVAMQRAAAMPYRYHFEIRHATPAAANSAKP